MWEECLQREHSKCRCQWPRFGTLGIGLRHQRGQLLFAADCDMLQRDPELLLKCNAGATARQGEASLDQLSSHLGSVARYAAVAFRLDVAARQCESMVSQSGLNVAVVYLRELDLSRPACERLGIAHGQHSVCRAPGSS